MNNLHILGYNYNIALNIVLLILGLITISQMFKKDSNKRMLICIGILFVLGCIRMYLRNNFEVVLIAKGKSSYIEYDSLYKKMYYYVQTKNRNKVVLSIDYGLKECSSNSQCIMDLRKKDVNFYKSLYQLNENKKERHKISNEDFDSYMIIP